MSTSKMASLVVLERTCWTTLTLKMPEKLLKDAKIWPLLSGEQLKQMITKDVDYCASIMAPPQGKSVSLPPSLMNVSS